MREIKFRAWGQQTEEYKYFLIGQNPLTMMLEQYVIVEQYTGLKDKNNKEIYEGDIFIDPHHGCMWIEYSNSQCCFIGWKNKKDNLACPMHFLGLNNIEIIGNIHENPELLEK